MSHIPKTIIMLTKIKLKIVILTIKFNTVQITLFIDLLMRCLGFGPSKLKLIKNSMRIKSLKITKMHFK